MNDKVKKNIKILIGVESTGVRNARRPIPLALLRLGIGSGYSFYSRIGIKLFQIHLDFGAKH